MFIQFLMEFSQQSNIVLSVFCLKICQEKKNSRKGKFSTQRTMWSLQLWVKYCCWFFFHVWDFTIVRNFAVQKSHVGLAFQFYGRSYFEKNHAGKSHSQPLYNSVQVITKNHWPISIYFHTFYAQRMEETSSSHRDKYSCRSFTREAISSISKEV